MRLAFDQFVIDTDTYELRCDGALCHVEPKVFDLIVHFARHTGQVFSHEQLIDAVWNARMVSENTVSTGIKSARKALGDDGNTQRYIKTVRGRGFRFDADVKIPDTPPPAVAAARAAAAITTPSLYIRAFRVLEDEPDARRLSGALAGDLGRVLSRMPLLRIRVQDVAGGATNISPSARAMHESTGTDFLLDGTLQRVGVRYRINVQLVDARSGYQLWGEQIQVDGPFDKALDDAPIAVISRLEPQLQRAMYDSVRSASGSPNAHQLFLEATGVMVFNGWGHQGFSEAAALLRQSRTLDPDFALAHAFFSLVTGFGDRVGLMIDREQTVAESLTAAERALELDSMDSTVLGYAGCAIADIGQRERARPILENAIEINASNAQAWVALGSVHVFDRRIEAGIEALAHGIAISPLDSRLSVWGTILTMALVQAGRLDDAVHEGHLACRRDHRCYLPRVALAGAHLVGGRSQEAAATLAEAYRIKPDLNDAQVGAIVGRRLGVALKRLSAGRAGAV